MNKMKNFWRMGLSALLALTVQTTARAWVPGDMGPKPGYIKCGITLYDKANNSLLPYVTMRFNFRGSSGGDAYFYLTSDSQGFAYLEVPMKKDANGIINGIIAGVDGNQNFDLKCLAGMGALVAPTPTRLTGLGGRGEQ